MTTREEEEAEEAKKKKIYLFKIAMKVLTRQTNTQRSKETRKEGER